jgi:hypothetical protein
VKDDEALTAGRGASTIEYRASTRRSGGGRAVTTGAAMQRVQARTKIAMLGLGVLVAYLPVAISLGGPSYAASPVTVALTPSTISLPAGETNKVVVVVTNPSDAAVKAKVRPLVPNDAIEVKPTGPAATRAKGRGAVPVRVPAQGSVALPFLVTRVSSTAAESLDVQFLTRVAVGRTVVASTLTVKAPASMFALEFKPGLDKLNEYRPDETSLIVSNSRDEAITLTRFRLTAPRDVTLTATCSGNKIETVADGETSSMCVRGATLPSRGHLVIPLGVEASSYLAPGPRTILVHASARTRDFDTASVVLGEDFTVDVYGESEILKALAVPIFLLLPGAIVMILGPLMVRHLSPWTKFPLPTLSLGSATGAVVASVAISLLFGLLYPSLTDLWPGERRDYRRAQGFEDFYWVFAWALLTAIGLWLLSLIAFGVYRLWRRLWQRNFAFTTHDGPHDVLRKVARRTWLMGDVQFPLVKVTHGAETKNGLELPKPTAKDKVYVAPRVTFQLPAEDQQSDEEQRVQEALTAFRDATRDGATDEKAQRKALRKLQAVLAETPEVGLHFRGDDVAEPDDQDRTNVAALPGLHRSVVFDS